MQLIFTTFQMNARFGISVQHIYHIIGKAIIFLKVISMKQNKRIQNQRPTLVVPPDISTSVKDIWIGNDFLLETLLVKFLPEPEPFRSKDALGWVRGFLYIYS